MDNKPVAKKASELRIGDSFIWCDQECLIVYADYNNYGQRIVRFVTDPAKNPISSSMVVPHDFKFKVFI